MIPSPHLPLKLRLLCAAVALSVQPIARAHAQGTVTVAIGDTTRLLVVAGTEIRVPILVLPDGGLDIAALQAGLTWGAGRLRLDSIRAGPFGTLTANASDAANGNAAISAFRVSGQVARDTVAVLHFVALNNAPNYAAGLFQVFGGTTVRLLPSAAGNEAAASILARVLPRNLDVCVVTGRWGDINADGAVNIIDAQQVARGVVGLTIANPTARNHRGDVTGDGTVNIIDAQQIARWVVGLTASPRLNTPAYNPIAVESVHLTPAAPLAVGIGGTLQLTADPLMIDGNSIGGCQGVTFSSSDPAKATVAPSGLVAGVSAGTVTITATSGARATSVSVTVGAPVASKTWTGAVSTSWTTAGNWSPSGVPTAADSVLIAPTINQPVLTGTANVGRLTMQPGTSLNLSNFDLNAVGSVHAQPSGISGGIGKIRINAPDATVAGGFTRLQILGGVTTAVGPVTVSSALDIDGGRFDVGAQRVTVSALNSGGGGAPRMQNTAGELIVTGNAGWLSAGVFGDSLLTAGTLRVRGNWNVGCLGAVFNASGTHTVVFDGTAAQVVAGSCTAGTAATQEHFRNLIVANQTANVTFNSTYVVTGAVTVNAGASATGTGTMMVSPGQLTVSGAYEVANTTFTGSGGSSVLPALSFQGVALVGAHVYALPPSGFAASGGVVVQSNAVLDVGAGSATVGTLTFQTGGRLKMQNPAGSLTATGTVSWNAPGWVDTLLTAGTLHVKAGWTVACVGSTAVFNASGTHTVMFDGTAAATQTVNGTCNSGLDANEDYFRHVVVANSAAAVSWPHTYHVSGTFTVNSGGTASGGGAIIVSAGGLTVNGTYGVTNTTFAGAGTTTTLQATNLPNLTLSGAHTYLLPASGFSVTGALLLQNGALLDVGSSAGTAGTLTFQSGSRLKMQHTSGSLTTGTVNWNADGWVDTLLTAGTLHVKAGWTVSCVGSTAVFNASGTHTVMFDGAAAATQTVAGTCNSGLDATEDHFRNVIVANTAAAVSWPHTYHVSGSFTVNSGATASGGGSVFVNAGALIVNGTYTVTNTTFTGTGGTSTLQATSYPNLTLTGAHTFLLPTSGFTVPGSLVLQSNALLDVGGSTNTVGALTFQSGSRLKMQNPAGSLTATGTVSWNAPGWVDTLLTAGTLHVKAGWTVACVGSTAVFNASGTHTVMFDGTAAATQTVNGTCNSGLDANEDYFRHVVVANSAAAVAWPHVYHLTGSFTVNAAATASGGGTIVAPAGAFTINGTYAVTNVAFMGTSGTSTLPATTFNNVTLDGAHRWLLPPTGFSATGGLTAANGAVFDVAAGVATVGAMTFNTGSRLRMRDAAGVLSVSGSVTFNTSGVLYRDSSVTAGTLRIAGGLGGTCGVDVFNASGNHTLEVFGGAAQSINPCADRGIAAEQFHLKHLRINKSAGTLTLGAVDVLGVMRVVSGTLSSANSTAWDSLVVTGGALTGAGITLRRPGTVIPANSLGVLTLKADAVITGGIASGAITADSGQLTVAGSATINGNFNTTRIGTLRMVAAATLTVTGSANFSGASTLGLLKAGRLEIGGSFTQGASSPTAFAADSAHVTVLNGTATQNVSLANPSETLSRFAHLEVSNTSAGGVVWLTNGFAKGNLVIPGTANDSVRFGISGGTTLTVGGVAVSGAGGTRARFRNLALVIRSFGLGSIGQFDGAVFEGFAATATQLEFAVDGGSHTFNNLTFRTVPTTGYYLRLSGASTTLNLVNASPGFAGTAGRTLVSGAGSTLNWSPP